MSINKKIALIITGIFILLTFSGAIYVLFKRGAVSAGFAVVPFTLTMASLSAFRSIKSEPKD